MEKILIIVILCLLIALPSAAFSRKTSFVVGADIRFEDVKDFYYTYSNINFNARYQRYRFYAEDGKYFFSYEHRERPDDYGPATEADITAAGTMELSEDQWKEFFSYLKDGTVQKRKEFIASGDSGPWTYLYWKRDKSVYQAYSFASGGRKLSFEAYCVKLVLRHKEGDYPLR